MRLACVLLIASGCYAQVAGMAKATPDGGTGGQIEAVFGGDTLRVGGALSVERGTHDGDDTTAVLFEYIARASLLGRLAHDKAPWVDFGPELDLGFGGASHGAIGSASAGGWLDVRLRPDDRDYPTLHFGARRIVYAGPVDDETALFAGIAGTFRDPSLHRYCCH